MGENQLIQESTYHINHIAAKQLSIIRKNPIRSSKNPTVSYTASGKLEGRDVVISLFFSTKETNLKSNIYVFWNSNKQWFLSGNKMLDYCDGKIKSEDLTQYCLVRNFNDESHVIPILPDDSKDRKYDHFRVSVTEYAGKKFKIVSHQNDIYKAETWVEDKSESFQIALDDHHIHQQVNALYCFWTENQRWFLKGEDFLRFCKGDLKTENLSKYCQSQQITAFLDPKEKNAKQP